MTGAEVMAAALADPDAKPLTPADCKRMQRIPRVKIMTPRARPHAAGVFRPVSDSARHAARLGADQTHITSGICEAVSPAKRARPCRARAEIFNETP
jgi:hypothetical protein